MSRCLVENCEWFNKDEVSIKLHELSYQQATAMLLRIHDAGHFRDMEVMAMNKLFESVENMEERRVA